ncbi:ACT domain-containing protein [Salinispora arenicola]|uniref:CASTOR ACT domain-containing protein n=1 Tax=Salinispora arenicola (strain CNS-205) TaxID=391037 RepID=A8LXC5_SALAI|nr:ACT domain-containing protein [Salinispora arenicola]MCN0177758.1 ACT domain-containing protein [Salinispora arenicola]NIL56475.1 ACT domain-containing protein [Salinispora arenicola]NIL62848.1 ACT domain-containing protein [Salinispora arenicola]
MLDIALLPGDYAVCRLAAGSALPPDLAGGLSDGDVVTVSWTIDGVSVICPAARAPAQTETTWRCLRVVGPSDLALSEGLATLVDPLAKARVTVVTFSTHDTDYLLVPAVRLDEAIAALDRARHRVRT